MSRHLPLISLEYRPDAGWRPTLGGLGFGPWLDERSAYFLVQWLTLSREGVQETLARLRVETTFEEAIGLASAQAPCPSPVAAGSEVPS